VRIDHQQTAMEVLEHQIKADFTLIIPNNDNNEGEHSGEVGNDDDAEEEEVDEMEELRRKRAKEIVIQYIVKSIPSSISSLIQGVACQWKLTLWWG
jgi:hypothetical protein